MIDTSNWKEFRVGDLFTQPKINKANAVPEESGPVPFISSTSENNGVASYCSVATVFSPCMTVSTNGACFDCFYHEEPIAVSTDVDVLMNEHLNAKTASFVMTILQMEKPKYSYGRKPKGNKVFDTIISLPATPSGEPDWKYMEDFMGGLHSEPLKTSVKSSHIPLETEKWGEFRVGDLFDVELAKGDIKLDEMLLGDMPLVSSGETNNGIVGYIDNNGDGKSERFDSNRITVDMFGNAYYQSEPFYAVSHGRVNILSPKFNLTPNAGLFLSTIIKSDQYKYSYGRAVYSRVVENMVIRLPQTPDGKPDWKWMEDYMRSLPYSDLVAA